MTTAEAFAGTRQLAAPDRRLPARLALDTLPVGVLICTDEGEWANAELHRIWRRPLDAPFDRSTFGRDLGRVATSRPRKDGPAVAAAGSPIDAALEGGRTGPARYRLHRDDGTSGIVRLESVPLRAADDRIVGAVVIATDETAQAESERYRDAFLGILGHELRTPITSIVGGSALLQDDQLEPEIRTEVAGVLADEAERLHRLVEQMIQIARLQGDEGKATEPVHLVHTARAVIARERGRRPRARIELDAQGGVPPASGDPELVAQVLTILIDNAAKYGGPTSLIVVRVAGGEREVCVDVLDEGPGLPEGRGEAMFELFERGPAAAGDRPGTGIGLFVARAIVEAMRGRVWATNREGRGADVGFALPVAAP